MPAETRLRIKEILRDKGITQKQLAERLGVNHVSFSQTLVKNNLTMKTLENIANALDVSVPELFIKLDENSNVKQNEFLAIVVIDDVSRVFRDKAELLKFLQ